MAKRGGRYAGLLADLGIDETFTRRTGIISYDKVRESAPPKEDYNFQADLLALPMTKQGYKYLLVVLDIWTEEFDAKPLKTKTAEETTRELKAIFRGKHLKKPYATLRTDSGSEFKGAFTKYLKEIQVIHSTTVAGRHKQTQAVETLNGLIGRFLNGYMNRKELETGAVYREWTDVLVQLVDKLNKLRKRPTEDPTKHEYAATPIAMAQQQKFKEGDVVIPVLSKPQDALGNQQNTENFRNGDTRWDFRNPRKILRVALFPNNVRYILEGKTNVAYTQDEIMLAPDQDVRAVVKKIIDKKTIRGKVNYLVWFKGERKAQAVWLPLSQLKEDGQMAHVTAYNRS